MGSTEISPARPLDASAWRAVADGHVDEDGAATGSARAGAREVRGEAGEGGKASRVRGRGLPVLSRARGAVDARHGAMASVDVLHDASLLQV